MNFSFIYLFILYANKLSLQIRHRKKNVGKKMQKINTLPTNYPWDCTANKIYSFPSSRSSIYFSVHIFCLFFQKNKFTPKQNRNEIFFFPYHEKNFWHVSSRRKHSFFHYRILLITFNFFYEVSEREISIVSIENTSSLRFF